MRRQTPLPGDPAERGSACPSPLREREEVAARPLPLPQGRGTDAERQGEGFWRTSKSTLRERAKTLRNRQTEPEAIFWDAVRAKRLEGMKFRRQVPMGRYIIDFVCPQAKLVVELDGSQHQEAAARAYDAERSRWLEAHGYTVLRFTNDDVLTDLDGVCRHIAHTRART